MRYEHNEKCKFIISLTVKQKSADSRFFGFIQCLD